MVCSCFSHVMFMRSCVDVNFNAMGIPLPYLLYSNNNNIGIRLQNPPQYLSSSKTLNFICQNCKKCKKRLEAAGRKRGVIKKIVERMIRHVTTCDKQITVVDAY